MKGCRMVQENELIKNKPTKYPCKDCEKRHAGCHADCGEYLEARKQNQAANAEEREKIDKQLDYVSYKMQVVERAKKRRRKTKNNIAQIKEANND